VSDLVQPDRMLFNPSVPSRLYRDGFGNWCTRIVAPPGTIVISSSAVVNDTGLPEAVALEAQEIPVDQLPAETLVFLLGSRYCETDRLSEFAWSTFGQTPPGWARLQSICDFVHQHITFSYDHADPKISAWDVFNSRIGVCRDFAHLAVALCRCMNIPARYCTGYLGDIGVPPDPAPMDFSGWFEAYLGGAWYTFDPRHNARRAGRILIAYGRDAADVAISTTFGQHVLERFEVWTEKVTPQSGGACRRSGHC
jgi:transglutaminase-like putative cysteine protease